MRRLARGRGGTVAMLAIVVAPLRAQIADPSALASGWVRESWSIADGLPVNSLNGLIQSRTGYIWAATFDGLVRFDGVRFTVYNSANSPGLPSDRILSLVETRDSALWMNTEQLYLVRFRVYADSARVELEAQLKAAPGNWQRLVLLGLASAHWAARRTRSGWGRPAPRPCRWTRICPTGPTPSGS